MDWCTSRIALVYDYNIIPEEISHVNNMRRMLLVIKQFESYQHDLYAFFGGPIISLSSPHHHVFRFRCDARVVARAGFWHGDDVFTRS